MLSINEIQFSLEGKKLFDGASAVIPNGRKVGVVGRNGSGKTTLFRLIRGELHPDDGAIKVPRGHRIGGVAQEAPASDDSLLDTVLAADLERAALLVEAENTADPYRIGEIQTRLVDIGAHSAEARASAILTGLGFDAAAQARPCHEFSGGWRMRVALAAVLFSQPDLLLLDEPTNYLDLEGTVWLEQFLARYPRTALIISHDRDLLNRSVNAILHLSNLELTYYTGGYDQFDAERRIKFEQHSSLKKKQDAQRAHIQSFVDRFRYKASKARQAQARLKMLEKMQPMAALTENPVAKFSFRAPEELSPPLIAIEGGAVGYGGAPVLRNLDLRIDQDDRIALLGANGQGKSTLSKLLADRLRMSEGKLAKSSKLRVGFFAQHQLDELTFGETPIQHLTRLRPGETPARIRARLGAAGIGADIAENPVERLSGGQKARLLMMLAAIDAPHIMILDEPTNHLDIESREALSLALNDYSGAVILVSHDPHLVETVADRLWLVKDGGVKPFAGDMADYKRLLLSERSGKAREEKKAKTTAKPAAKPTPRPASQGSLGALRAAVRTCEDRIAKLEKMRAKVEARLASPELYSSGDPDRIADLSRKRTEIIDGLARAEKMWLVAQDNLERTKTG